MYHVLVAADIFGTKLNYEVPFLGAPSMGELNRRVQEIFGGECASKRPHHVPASYAFAVQRVQVFDDRTGLWVDLANSAQLSDGCQLYAFQPDSAYHREVQTTLPAAVPLPAKQPHSAPAASHSAASTTPASPPRARPAAAAAHAPRFPYGGEHSLPTRSPTTHGQPPGAGLDPLPTPSPLRYGAEPLPPHTQPSRLIAPVAAADTPGILGAATPLPSASLQMMLANLHDAPAPPVAYQPPTPAAPALAPIETSLEEKTRVIFDEVGDKVTGMAPLGDFGALLKTLRIDLPPGIHLSDLFVGIRDVIGLPHDTSLSPARGALSPGAGGGSVNYGEFVRFAERYPTLTDALFSRCRQFWVEVKQKEDLGAAGQLLDTLRVQLTAACEKSTHAFNEVTTKELDLRAAETDLTTKETVERDSQHRVAHCREERDQAAADVRRREEAVSRCQEQARSGNADLAEAQRQVHYFASLAQGKDLEVRRAEDKVRELERLLREAQGELENRRMESDTARAEVHAAEAREHEKAAMKLEFDRVTAAEDQQLALAEKALVTYREREHESESSHVGHQEAVVQARALLYTVQQDVGVLKEFSSRAKIEADDAKKRVENQEQALHAMEVEATTIAANARRVETEEQPLLEQELHLRAQRAALELKETQLRTQHCNFQMRNSARAGILSQPAG
eukprot:TRINITY_DN6048_c0_g1_i1.p1 TRINITY_DN6048_c0_g1~~TRINITY_DN6048_c0_g1_i1.p1  ORF type:complete len:680 (+),score=288.19 TRINITY_DN6048_c0_g1_i1:586-2625(+)